MPTILSTIASTSGVTTVTNANYTITNTDGFSTILVSTGNTNRTITLPAVASNVGRSLLIKKTDSGTGSVTLTPNGGTIDGAPSFTLSARYNRIGIVSDGSNWNVEQDGLLRQTKILGANVQTPTTPYTVLSFNLTPGSTYRVTVSAGWTGVSSTGPIQAVIGLRDSGTAVANTNTTLMVRQTETRLGFFGMQNTNGSFIITMNPAGTGVLTLVWESYELIGAAILLNGTPGTWMTVEQLTNNEVTTVW